MGIERKAPVKKKVRRSRKGRPGRSGDWVQVAVRFRPEEYAIIKTAAFEAGLKTVPAFCKKIVDTYMEGFGSPNLRDEIRGPD